MWALRILGSFFFALGAVGLVIPIWPTAIFWIVAALCFLKSDPHWAAWIYARPKIGPVIQLFVETGMLTREAKVASLLGMGVAVIPILLVGWRNIWALVVGLGLICIGSAYVVSRRSP